MKAGYFSPTNFLRGTIRLPSIFLKIGTVRMIPCFKSFQQLIWAENQDLAWHVTRYRKSQYRPSYKDQRKAFMI